MLKALTNATIFTGNEIISKGTVLIDGEKTVSAGSQLAVPPGAEVTDCSGMNIAPGFIDLQIAGAAGLLFSSYPEPGALEKITDGIVRSGTTGFLLVLPTNSSEVYSRAIRTVHENPHHAVLGLHMEGPFISHEKKGAHNSKYIRKPELKELENLLSEGKGVIKMVTVAPEHCFPDFIKMIKDYGAVACAGHSNATFEQARRGFDWGIEAVTHLFNAQSSIHHRDPGLPGAAFLEGSVMASIVADGVHVDFSAIRIAKNAMKERLYLISDAVEENSIGEYWHVRQADRYTLPDGTLSGSALTMMKAVENCVTKSVTEPDEALRMASAYPAKLMKLNTRGKIAAGMTADLTVFNGSYQVKTVYLKGSRV
jgi:N-acetylglucosamine-6-phosphate deacetylase